MKSVSVFSLVAAALALAGCGGGPVRPNADACWVNAPGAKKVCYNVLTDYDNEGRRKPEAQPKQVPLPRGLRDLNANLCFTPEGQTEFLRYLEEMRKYAKDHCK